MREEPFSRNMYTFRYKIPLQSNFWAGLVYLAHLGASIGLAIVYHSDSIRGTLTIDFLGSGYRVLGLYPLVWLCIPLALVPALNHLFIFMSQESVTWYRYYLTQCGYNPYRWVQSAISMSLTTWIVLQVAGVSNIVVLVIMSALVSAVIQMQGFLINDTGYTRIPVTVQWISLISQWTFVGVYFFDTVLNGAVAWYTYTIVLGMVAFQSLQLYFDDYHHWGTPCDSERAYIWLTVLSTTYLVWNVLIAMIVK